MMLDSDIRGTPNAAVNESFKLLEQEVRAGNFVGYMLITKFAPRYHATLPQEWRESPGTLTAFGDTEDLLMILDQATRSICSGLNPDDRMAVGFMLMAGALGNKRPILARIDRPITSTPEPQN